MSEEAKPDEQPAPKGGIKALLTKLPVLIGGVMVIEAAVLLVGVKMMGGGPATAGAAVVEYAVDAHGNPVLDEHGNPVPAEHGEAGGEGHAAEDPDELAEVGIDSFRAPNRQNGRTYLWDVALSVRVKAGVKEQVEAKLKNSKGLVLDRMNGIIAAIDPQKLNGAVEPGLETLRRQVKYQLNQILGEGVVDEVLVPRCIPYRMDY